MNTKRKFLVFLLLFLALIGIAVYLAYNFFIKSRESDDNSGESGDSNQVVVYEKPDHFIKGDISGIKERSVIVINRENNKEEQYSFLDDTECSVIDAENDEVNTCNYDSLTEGVDEYLGVGAKLVIYSDTSDIKKIDIFISDM